MILTASTIQQAVGCSATVSAQWAQPLTDACNAFCISTPKRVAAFLAQVGHESASLTSTAENLNYGAQGLADTWPSRYAVDPKAKPKRPNDLARALERKPAAIGNNAYPLDQVSQNKIGTTPGAEPAAQVTSRALSDPKCG